MQNIEEIAPGITIEWIENRRIGIIQTPTSPNRAVQEIYYNYLCDLMKNWDAKRPLLMLYEAQHANIFLTTYDRHRTHELAQIANERKFRSRSAVILKKTVVTQMISAFLLLITKKSSRQSQNRVFHDVEAGLRWLKEGLEE